MADISAAKETKAQRAERLKREKNPWDAIDEIRAFARSGRSSIPEEWSAYFRCGHLLPGRRRRRQPRQGRRRQGDRLTS